MKAMPLLLPGQRTMIIQDDFKVALAINSFALRQMTLNVIYRVGHISGLSGGFMVLRGKDVQSPKQKNKN